MHPAPRPHSTPRHTDGIATPAILSDLDSPDRQEIPPLVFLRCAWCGGVISAVPCCEGCDSDGEGA